MVDSVKQPEVANGSHMCYESLILFHEATFIQARPTLQHMQKIGLIKF